MEDEEREMKPVSFFSSGTVLVGRSSWSWTRWTTRPASGSWSQRTSRLTSCESSTFWWRTSRRIARNTCRRAPGWWLPWPVRSGTWNGRGRPMRRPFGRRNAPWKIISERTRIWICQEQRYTIRFSLINLLFSKFFFKVDFIFGKILV